MEVETGLKEDCKLVTGELQVPTEELILQRVFKRVAKGVVKGFKRGCKGTEEGFERGCKGVQKGL